MRTLVIGGARSGKSRTAESLLRGRVDVTYVATGYPADADDAAWAERVRRHRADRPAAWATVETTDLVPLLETDGGPLLVDCLTLWLTRVLDDAGAWETDAPVDDAVQELVESLRTTGRWVVLVTNEVGQGVIPTTPSGRRFVDEMGRLNAAVAAVCDDVLWCVAGRTVRL